MTLLEGSKFNLIYKNTKDFYDNVLSYGHTETPYFLVNRAHLSWDGWSKYIKKAAETNSWSNNKNTTLNHILATYDRNILVFISSNWKEEKLQKCETTTQVNLRIIISLVYKCDCINYDEKFELTVLMINMYRTFRWLYYKWRVYCQIHDGSIPF